MIYFNAYRVGFTTNFACGLKHELPQSKKLRRKRGNIAAPLSVCTKEGQCTVMWFLLTEIGSGSETHRRLSAQYGSSAFPQRSVHEWITMFKHFTKSVSDEERSGRPSTSTTEETIPWFWIIDGHCWWRWASAAHQSWFSSLNHPRPT
jgi:hypothetical protein